MYNGHDTYYNSGNNFSRPASIFFGGFWAGLIMMLTDPYGKSGKIAFFGGFTVGGILLIIQWAMMG